MAVSNLSNPAVKDAPIADGRRERSRSSRSRIVAALLELVGNGDVSPSAARVAEAAGVGLRSVFRHFNDMDALYSEMGKEIEVRIQPLLVKPLIGASWKGRIYDLAERRARVFETIMPYRISGNLRRFESAYLMQDYRRMLRLERDAIHSHLPDAVRDDLACAQGLNVILSFQTWRLLRHDHDLSVETAKAVVLRLLGPALGELPDD